MRALVILCCLVVAANAASLGYEYERNNGGAISSGVEHLSQPVQQANEFSKEFYTFTAPEHEFNQGDDHNDLAESLKKSLRVIFIRGPENHGIENAALQLAKSASDERTAIYVLTKQADVSDLAHRLNNLHHHNANKPAVHFVKYRTQADADNAQRTIQQQYDALGGSSTSHNGGVAPVLNFASQGPAHVSSGGGVEGSLGGGLGSGFGGGADGSLGSGFAGGAGSGLGSGFAGGAGSGLGSGLGSGFAGGAGSGLGSGLGSGFAGGAGSSLSSGLGSGLASGLGSGLGSSLGSGLGSGLGGNLGGGEAANGYLPPNKRV